MRQPGRNVRTRLTDGPGRYGAEEGPPLHVGELHGEGEVGNEVTSSAEARSEPRDDEDDPVWGESVAQAQRKLTCTWRYVYYMYRYLLEYLQIVSLSVSVCVSLCLCVSVCLSVCVSLSQLFAFLSNVISVAVFVITDINICKKSDVCVRACVRACVRVCVCARASLCLCLCLCLFMSLCPCL